MKKMLNTPIFEEEKQEFLATGPEVYLIVDSLSLDEFVVEKLSPLSREGVGFNLVLTFSEVGIELPVLQELLNYLFTKLNIREISYRGYLVSENPDLLNSIRKMINSRFFTRMSESAICFTYEEVSTLLNQNLNLPPSLLIYLGYPTLEMEPWKEVFEKAMENKDILYLYLDYHPCCMSDEKADKYFDVMCSLFGMYEKYVIDRGSSKVYTFNYFLKGSGPQCFAGDCITNTFTVYRTQVYSCFKQTVCSVGQEGITTIEREDNAEDILYRILLNEARIRLKEEQKSRKCDCKYWNICHAGCGVYSLRCVKCKKFFEMLEIARIKLHERISDFEKRREKELLINFLRRLANNFCF